eukprot:scaffold28587_cov63-Phaeocystis_antarctica.AAC.2
MESEVALTGSTTVCFATTPPASQKGSMKSALAPPVAIIVPVAGTIAENHAAVKAPPISEPAALNPVGGTSTRSVPASERLMLVRAPTGFVARAATGGVATAGAVTGGALSSSKGARASQKTTLRHTSHPAARPAGGVAAAGRHGATGLRATRSASTGWALRAWAPAASLRTSH